MLEFWPSELHLLFTDDYVIRNELDSQWGGSSNQSFHSGFFNIFFYL